MRDVGLKREGSDEEANDDAVVVVPNVDDDKKLLLASDILFRFTTYNGKNKLCLIMAVIYFIVIHYFYSINLNIMSIAFHYYYSYKSEDET